jgi:hypothetical protein
MRHAQSFYERPFYKALTWWFVTARIGQGLRARYQAPKELPPKLLVLLVQLDAIEGNFLRRYVPPLERRGVEESDWLPPRFVWQNDADLFLR